MIWSIRESFLVLSDVRIFLFQYYDYCEGKRLENQNLASLKESVSRDRVTCFFHFAVLLIRANSISPKKKMPTLPVESTGRNVRKHRPLGKGNTTGTGIQYWQTYLWIVEVNAIHIIKEA
jgi:hypothetical protein